VKAALLAVLIGFGAVNRRRNLPGLRAAGAGGPGRQGVVLRRTLRAEVALIAGVLAATAVLTELSPTQATSGPFATTTDLGAAQLELTVDPGTAGANEIHAYLFDSQTGAQYEQVKEFEIGASLPAESIGPLELDARKAGPGHYVVRDAELGIQGDWELEVDARVSAFEELSAVIEVPVR
jgi:copper transport protein